MTDEEEQSGFFEEEEELVEVTDEGEEESEDEVDDAEDEPKPALVINIYSWLTPVLAVIMLVSGLLLGYFGRPLIERSPAESLVQQITPLPQQAVVDEPSVPVDATQATADLNELMGVLTTQVRHFKGDAQAPVTIIEFSDFQCPFCGRFATDAGHQIDEAYVNNGLVRFGYWHVAFLGPESQWAAEASECAAEQDRFWEYHDYLFEHQSGENQGAFNKDQLKTFAAVLELDTSAFDECLDSGRYTDIINTDTNQARSIGATSTPAFLINGQPVVGAQSFEVFQQVIDLKLAEAGR